MTNEQMIGLNKKQVQQVETEIIEVRGEVGMKRFRVKELGKLLAQKKKEDESGKH